MQDSVNGLPPKLATAALLEEVMSRINAGRVDTLAIVVVDGDGATTTAMASVGPRGPRNGDIMNGLDMLKLRLLAAVMGFELKPVQRSPIVRAPAGLVG